MSWQDTVNGSYETLGGIMILLSVLRLHREKQVRGISILACFFFTTWGYWNLYYYWQLAQHVSWLGGIGVVIMNTIWLSQILWYSYKETT